MLKKRVNQQAIRMDAIKSVIKPKPSNGRSSNRKRRTVIIGVVAGFILPIWAMVVLWIASISGMGDVGKVIASDSYSNFAWGFSYNGTLITDTGKICKVRLDDDQQSNFRNANETGLEEFSDFLLDNATCHGKVSGNDLARLQELVGRIHERKLVKPDSGIYIQTFDAGTTCINAWNYTDGRSYSVKCSGDLVGENPDDDARELIQLVWKYTTELDA